MRRIPILAAAVLAFAATPARAAGPSARLAECAVGATPIDRAVSVVGTMQAVPGAQRMGMRFELLERRPGGGGFHRVAAPRLGVWQKSRPLVPAFTVTKRIDGLAAPAAYRAVVRFRWYGPGGQVVRRAQRTTAVCRQPDPRPNLAVGRVDVLRGPDAQHSRYVVAVRNTGHGDAAAVFGVLLAVDGVEQPAQTLAALGAGGRATVSFLAPPCSPGSTIRVLLDATNVIPEADETDNAVTRPCPAKAARGASARMG